MAKHCNVCNQNYSDGLTSCPHCGKTAAIRPVDILEADPQTPAESTSEFNPHLADTPRAVSAAHAETHADFELDRPGVQSRSAGSAPAGETSAVNLGGAPSGTLPSASGTIPPPSGLALVNEALDEGMSAVLHGNTSEPPESARFATSQLGEAPPHAKPSAADVIEPGAGLAQGTEALAEREERVSDQSRIVLSSDSAVDLTAPGPLVDSPSNPFVAAAEPRPPNVQATPDETPTSVRLAGRASHTIWQSITPWLAGGAVGALAGAGLCLTLWLIGVEPPSGWRQSAATATSADIRTTGQSSISRVAADEEEANGLFWTAAKLAEREDFALAVATLQKVRESHDEKHLGNAGSDAHEEILLKCCSELDTYWRLRSMLKESGYAAGQQDTPAVALEAALRDAKFKERATAFRNESEQLSKELATEKRRRAEQTEAAQQAEQKVKALTAQADTADTQAKTAAAKLKEATARLETAGIKTTDIASGIEELAAAKADAQARLAEANKQRALKQPDSLTRADFLSADRHFAAGLRLYHDGNYADAEEEFRAATRSDGQDARYYYYLGLSRLLCNKNNAAWADFEQAAKLEAQGRPDRTTVSDALERVQGPPRRELDRFRP